MVVLRPGDRLIYESIPGSYEEIEVAALLALKPGGKIATCARCRRQVVPANPGSTTAMLARSLLSRLFNR
ncbi:MAG TPA: hypothetical protein VMT58_04210 [Candidatus Binataceae bacterium]|nr:hypothetical protein [Candidatus Binataceae bacterium]